MAVIYTKVNMWRESAPTSSHCEGGAATVMTVPPLQRLASTVVRVGQDGLYETGRFNQGQGEAEQEPRNVP